MSAIEFMRPPVPDSPPAKDTMSPARRSTDLAKTSVPLPMVLWLLGAIAITAFAVGGAQYVISGSDRVAQAQMQSDIRDIRTRMENQTEVRKLEKELLDAQLASMKSTIESTGLRNAAMAMSTEINRQNAEKR